MKHNLYINKFEYWSLPSAKQKYQIENYEFQRSEFRHRCQISIVERFFARLKFSSEILILKRDNQLWALESREMGLNREPEAFLVEGSENFSKLKTYSSWLGKFFESFESWLRCTQVTSFSWISSWTRQNRKLLFKKRKILTDIFQQEKDSNDEEEISYRYTEHENESKVL